MPAGNGTGPMGMGPMTGRRMGYCSGNVQPGYSTGRGLGRGRSGGRGMRRGNGMGAGFSFGSGAGFAPQFAAEEDRRRALELQAEQLRLQLRAVEAQLETPEEG